MSTDSLSCYNGIVPNAVQRTELSLNKRRVLAQRRASRSQTSCMQSDVAAAAGQRNRMMNRGISRTLPDQQQPLPLRAPSSSWKYCRGLLLLFERGLGDTGRAAERKEGEGRDDNVASVLC